MSLRTELENTAKELWTDGHVTIRPLETEEDLIYAGFDCRLTEEQQEMVNPAWFSIGRAYLDPENEYPCLIMNGQGEPVGFIHFARWRGEGAAYTWSFFIDQDHQGKGYGRSAAQTAVRLLKAAAPGVMIKLAAEQDNKNAHRLYESLGFVRLTEMDGDDLVFGL